MTPDRLWRVDRLRVRWQDDATLGAALEAALDEVGFEAGSPTSITSVSGKRKHIKDGVWGMVEFDHAEIQLIDSPLLQRLRGIRQLGFSYLVYPSAEHTRIVHSLGMAHVVASFITSINRNEGRPVTDSAQVRQYNGIASLAPLTSRDLVFAALLHDVGHMPFSHASETALVQRDGLFTCGGRPLEEVLLEARYAIGKDVSLSETCRS